MMKEKQTVTSFLESESKILILLRSEHVSTYQGRWGGISGSVDGDKTPDEQASLEIKEETCLSGKDIELVRKGEPLLIEDKELDVKKMVHPYLFHVKNPSKIKIHWEHKQIKWIKPKEIDDYETMPELKETLAKVLR